jgi:hypothetical protein
MMKRNWLAASAVAVALALVPTAGFAQVRSDTGKAKESLKAEGRSWDSVLEKIRPIYLKRLSEELQLDQETLDKMAQSYDLIRGQRRELAQERRALVTKLEEAFERNAPDSELEAILDEYDSVQTRRRELWTSQESEMRHLLGTRGYAKYMLFRQKFRKEIHQTLREFKKKEG